MPPHKTTEIKPRQDSWIPTLEPEITDCVEFLGNWNQSMLEFYIDRIQQYCRAPFEINPFSSPEGYLRFQERFLTKMVADYAEQADKLVALASREQQVCCDPSQPGYEARLLQAQDHAAQIIEQAKAQAERIVASAESRAEQITEDPGRKTVTTRRRKSA